VHARQTGLIYEQRVECFPPQSPTPWVFLMRRSRQIGEHLARAVHQGHLTQFRAGRRFKQGADPQGLQ
jgi:hypothetical protein